MQGGAWGGLSRASSLPFHCSLWPHNRVQIEWKHSNWTASIEVIKDLLIQSCGFGCENAAERPFPHTGVCSGSSHPTRAGACSWRQPSVYNTQSRGTEAQRLSDFPTSGDNHERNPDFLLCCFGFPLRALQTSLLVSLIQANTSLANNGIRVAGAQAGQFPSVLLTSLSLPTELTNFQCWCKKQEGSHFPLAECIPTASPKHPPRLSRVSPIFCTGPGDRHRPTCLHHLQAAPYSLWHCKREQGLCQLCGLEAHGKVNLTPVFPKWRGFSLFVPGMWTSAVHCIDFSGVDGPVWTVITWNLKSLYSCLPFLAHGRILHSRMISSSPLISPLFNCSVMLTPPPHLSETEEERVPCYPQKYLSLLPCVLAAPAQSWSP